jgi:hypothetical protein
LSTDVAELLALDTREFLWPELAALLVEEDLLVVAAEDAIDSAVLETLMLDAALLASGLLTTALLD